ncbi:MAG: urate oxidase [Akkermansiaceae bacterium]|nr:urate oxidase [Akkermansiaceae bacterium]
MATLHHSQYGKHRVRVLKVFRAPDGWQDVRELTVRVMLTLSEDASFSSEDNHLVVPTDTVRNTVNFLAHDSLGACRHAFTRVVGRHFLATYAHVASVDVVVEEKSWDRWRGKDGPHPHVFTHQANGSPETYGVFSREGGESLASGLRDHLILKSTASSFTGYHQCPLTTLPPAEDRILATRLSGRWTFADGLGEDALASVDERVLAAMMETFAGTHSPSVQRTLFLMGEAALAAAPEIVSVTLHLPNVHYLGLDMSKLGRPGQKDVYLPTDEPHGQIEATITR